MKRFEHQVAGHDSLLSYQDNRYVLKPVNSTELKFYLDAQSYPTLLSLIPKYDGLLQDFPKIDGKDVIKLENLLFGFHKPCIADVKIGSRLYGDDASSEKIYKMQQLSLTTTSSSLQYRFTGMKVWHKNHYHIFDKTYGKSLNSENIIDALHSFIPSKRISIAEKFIEQLTEIQQTLSNLDCRFYSASVLLIYDPCSEQTVAKLIDFAHSNIQIGLGPHWDFISGISNLISLFRSYD